jgi:3-isopropylmalate/(R)-2-methylmalate dehydratase small subunit
MEPFTKLTAVAAPYDAVNADTDQIVPARFLKYARAPDGYGNYLFHDLRFDEAGGERPDFVLNQPAYRDAGILVTNTNFGCGSSREGAVYALADHGIRAVIGPSFGDIFYNNSLKNGLLPVVLGDEEAAALRAYLAAHPGAELTVDLEAQAVTAPDGTIHAFDLDPFWRDALLKGLDELGMTLELVPEIEAFEAGYYTDNPWLRRP